MKIASWNVNSLKVRLPHVLDWLIQCSPDVLALQETKVTDEAFPKAEIEALGYHVIFSGQRTYNGVAMISRFPMTDIVTDFPGFEDEQRRILAATINGVRVVDLYVPNGSEVGSDKYAYKLKWLEALKNFTEESLKEHQKVVLLGDFNIAPRDEDVHDPEKWKDCVLVSELERKALNKILDLGFRDTFRLFEQPPKTFSWWDYRMMAFRRKQGLRIDLILASELLAATCWAAGVDVEPRRLERPSDHAPVFADFSMG